MSPSETMIESSLRALPEVQPPAELLANVLHQTGIADLYWRMPTPIGDVFVAASRNGVTAVDRADGAEHFETTYAARFGRDVRRVAHAPVKLERSIERWFGGDRRNPPPFDLAGLTDFETDVLHKAMQIPRGQVRPYGWIAQQIGRPQASRAVGTALARNPVPLLIPCHRVVRGDGVIGHYIFGTDAKREMLEAEKADIGRLERLGKSGIRFVGSDTTHIFCFPTCRYNVSEAHLQTFHSEEEARTRGYRPCKVCQPALAS